MGEKAYGVLRAESAAPSDDGTHVILTFSTQTDDLPIAIPAGELPPMVALVAQAAGQARAIAGIVPDQQILECEGAETYPDTEGILLHLRLAGGFALPVSLTLRAATDLRDRLSVSLAEKSSAPPRTRQ